MGEQAPGTPRVLPPPSYGFHESKTPKGIVARYRKENNKLKLENRNLKNAGEALHKTIKELEAEILELKKEKFAGSLTICNKVGELTIT